MTVVYLAVEGEVDMPVAERLIRHVGLEPCRAIVAGGAPKLDPRIPELIRSAVGINWLVLRDLDRASCAPQLLQALVANRDPARSSIRIPVRSVESWLLADVEGFAETFSVHSNRLPNRPDDLPDPKLHLVNVCRASRQSKVRRTIPPRTGSNRSVGPEYVSRISSFVRNAWDPERGARRSPSLQRTISALQRRAADGTWS